MNHVFNIHTLRKFKWSCDFNPNKCPSTNKQHHRVNPLKEGSFTPNITSFSTERSSYFKIHGTQRSLKDKE